MSSRGRGKINFSDYKDMRKADNKESKDKEKIAARSAIIIELFEKIRHERALRHNWISTHVFADTMNK
jgi:ribosomal protein S25